MPKPFFLPDEPLLILFSFLNKRNLYNAGKVCKQWRRVANFTLNIKSTREKKLMLAVQSGTVEDVEAYLDKEVDINAEYTFEKNGKQTTNTLLDVACQRGADDIVELLLKNGANPNTVNHEGNNPILTAVMHFEAKPERSKIIRLLLTRYADFNHKNEAGLSAHGFIKKEIEIIRQGKEGTLNVPPDLLFYIEGLMVNDNIRKLALGIHPKRKNDFTPGGYDEHHLPKLRKK